MSENDRIRKVRIEKGMTLEEFGHRVGVQKSAISKVERGENSISDQLRTSILREFDVNECWLRTGEGDMFIQRSRGDQITAFVGDILNGPPDFRQRFISVLSRMTPEEWDLLEKKILELADEIKKPTPDGSA